jgi:hypothetical protein
MSPVLSIKNKYAKRSKISEAKFRKLIQLFAMDLDAKAIAALTNLNRNTVNRYLTLIRGRIAEFSQQKFPIKKDGDYVRSQLFGTGIYGDKDSATLIGTDTPVFGILQYKDQICTVVLPGTEYQISKQCDVCELTGPVDADNYQIRDKREYSAGNENLIEGIESFLSFTKKRLMKFHGIPESTFYLHFKECEFRFNHRNEDIYPILLNIIRNNPLC